MIMATKTKGPAVVAFAIGAGLFAFGVWAMVSPRSFFEQFAQFDPYNQHFLQDLGAFQIGLGTVLLIGGIWPQLDGLTTGLLGVGIGATMHVLSHVIGRGLGGRPAVDIPVFGLMAVLLVIAGALRLRTTTG
jgi:hypothetical protein